ncbi:ArgE/DapE family deacylase [Amphibacillus jilinensis]|uniref:ArgE/DapE family deacylase n=1 Tax=Amphibacillus jilinensis TaxID=1216008 RepID=UPI0002E448A3|nr:ArgE/DapE family deacylase [Amphibacillus jilinensis]
MTKEQQLDFLKTLIKCDTTTIGHGLNGNEINAQKVMIEKFEQLNLELDIFEPENEKLYRYKEADRGHHYENRPNVIGVWKGSGGGRSLILNGHIDTMPFDHLDQWLTHPLDPVEHDGKLYGRGSCDMKAGVAAMTMAIEEIKREGIRLKGDVILESVVDEEGGGNGTLACVERGYKADGAIVTEPTELKLMPTHMGWLFYKMTFTGQSLHSALKWKGVNAIEKALKIILALQELEREWAITKRDPMLPPPTINIGTIEGGMAGSVVPDACTLNFGLHYLPSDSDDENLGSLVEKELMEVINRAIASDAWLTENPPTIEKYQEGSGYQLEANHPLVTSLSQVSSKVMAKEVVIEGCAYGSDARLLSNYGHIPSIVFGPGNIEQAHGINEFVDIEQYHTCIDVLVAFIKEWCGVDG